MSPRWHKVIRDLWGNKSRTVLVVLAIAVGVFAFGGVFITQDVLIRDMNVGYLSIRPAHAILNVSPFDDGVVSAIRGMREIEDAEGRTTLPVKLEVAPDEWVNLSLVVISDYDDIHINRITSQAGSYPPDRRELVIERASLPLSRAQIGDSLHIELPDGELRDLTLVGTVHDFNALPANFFPQGTGYITRETLEWMGQDASYTELNFIIADPDPTRIEVEAVTAEVTDRLEAQGFTVGGTTVSEPGKHWASDVTQAFTTILSSIGIFSLLLSGFLVVNTISAILAQQKRQIGMMKAVGGRGGQVLGVYLVTVGIFGILGLFVAVPLGLGFAWLSAKTIAGFLNFDIVSFHLPLFVLLLQAITAVGIPLIAAFFPVWAGTRITVREAVSDYGISGLAKVGLIDRLLSRVRGFSRPVLLSLRNTFRRKGRLYLTLGTLTMAGAIFIAILNVRSSLLVELDKILDLFNYDIQLSLGDQYNVRQIEREAMRVEGVTSVEGWSAAQVQRLREDGTEGSTITLFGPPPETSFILPTVIEGRWLLPDDQNAIVINRDVLRDEPDLKLGDELRLLIGNEKRNWIIVGIIERAGEPYAYANFAYLTRIQGAPGESSVVMVGTAQHDGEFQSEAARTLEERFKRAGITVSGTFTIAEIYGANVGQFDFLIGFMMVMAVLLAVVGALGLTGTMSLNVLERTREIGVMRAIGASNGTVGSIVMTEGVLIGLMSWCLGILVSVGITYGLNYAVGTAFLEHPLVFTFSPVGPLSWLLIVIILAVFASLLPARSASRITVRDALAYE
jgi:putative ABC transport system permease protein